MGFLTVINPGAEDPIGSEWVGGTLDRKPTAAPGLLNGDFFYVGGSGSSSPSYQRISITDPTDIASIASGLAFIRWGYISFGLQGDRDSGVIAMRFLDSTLSEISTFSPEEYCAPTNTVREFSFLAPVPSNTTAIEIEVRSTRRVGTETSFYFDDITVEVLPSNPFPLRVPLTVINPGAEDTVGAEWVNISGGIIDSTPFNGDHNKIQGSSVYAVARASTGYNRQVVALDDPLILPDLTNGALTVTVQYKTSSFTDSDTGALGLVALDSGGAVVASLLPAEENPPTAWEQRELTLAIPSSAVSVGIDIYGTRVSSGTELSVYFDDIVLFATITEQAEPPPPPRIVSQVFIHRYQRIQR